MSKTVLITGASSGFGKDAALFFRQQGWNVAATMRSPDQARAWSEPAGLFTPSLDVTDRLSMQAAIDATVARFGGIDVLINNAGFALKGPLEGAAPEDLRRNLDTNVMGVIAMTQLVLPVMRQAGGGVIINLSSVGGRVTFPLFSTYHATKFALEGLTEALQYELLAHRIRVKLVEPGASRTNFDSTSMVVTPHPAYRSLMDGFDRSWARIVKNLPGTEKVVQTIYRAATDDSTRLRYPVIAFPVLAIRTWIGARGWSWLMKAMVRRW